MKYRTFESSYKTLIISCPEYKTLIISCTETADDLFLIKEHLHALTIKGNQILRIINN